MTSSHRIARGGMYHRLNPPISVPAARTRLDDIDRAVAEITAKLLTRPRPEGGTFRHDEWVRRCTTVLAYFGAERQYLDDWCIDPFGQHAGKRAAEKAARQESLAREIDDLLSSAELKYVPTCTPKSSNLTIDTLVARRESLKDLVDCVEHAEAVMMRRALGLGVQFPEWELLRHPFVRLLGMIEREQRFVSDLSRVGLRIKPIRFLLGMLDTAMQSGFSPRSEDALRIEAIRMAQAQLSAKE